MKEKQKKRINFLVEWLETGVCSKQSNNMFGEGGRKNSLKMGTIREAVRI